MTASRRRGSSLFSALGLLEWLSSSARFQGWSNGFKHLSTSRGFLARQHLSLLWHGSCSADLADPK